MPCYKIEGVIPVVHPEAYIHPTAVLIGDVHIGKLCYVGPNASLRGDFGRIILKDGANIQDNCVMHGFPETDTVIEVNGHVGHGAILHGCIVGKDALIGMNSVILDKAVIAERSIVAANSLVKAGFTCEPQHLILGSPAKVIRLLTEQEVAWKQEGTLAYQTLTQRCLASLEACEPLTTIEDNRPRLHTSTIKSKQSQS